MLTGEMAKYQIQDRVHAAERDRAAASIRIDRDRGRTAIVRKVGSGLLAVVVGRRKAAPTSAAIGIRLG
jgi:hypothetical protein